MNNVDSTGIAVSGDLLTRNESIRKLFELLSVEQIEWLVETEDPMGVFDE